MRKRRQMGLGTGLSFWQFERAGVRGVLVHPRTVAHVETAMRALRYGGIMREASACHRALEHQDTLACIFARLLLWTLPSALPTREEPANGWAQYLEAWRPGKPHPETWEAHWQAAWELVEPMVPPEVAA